MKRATIVPALLSVCAALTLTVPAAAAQTYPSKSVRLIVPFPAGSATDQVARLTGLQLQEALGQPFVIDNRPGAQGIIAAEMVAKSASDGYTILVTTNTPQAANVSLFKKLPYDPVKDFAPVARLGTIPFVLVVRPGHLTISIDKSSGWRCFHAPEPGFWDPGNA